MRIIVFGDLHARPSSPHDPDVLSRCVRSVEWVAELAQQRRADVVVNLGDTFDRARDVDYSLHNAIARAFDPIADRLHHLVGNHDIVSKRSLDYATETLPGRVYSELELVEIDGKRLGMAPYVHSRTEMPWDRADIVFAHLGLDDVRFPGGATFGPWHPEDFRAPVTLSGHYHHRTTFERDDTVFHYIGAMLPNGFKDAGLPFTGAWEVVLMPDGRVLHREHANPHAVPYLKVDGGNKLPEGDAFVHLKGVDPAALSTPDPRIVKVTLPKVEPQTKVQGRNTGKIADAIGAFAKANKLDVDVALEHYEPPPSSSLEPWVVESLHVHDFLSVDDAIVEVPKGIVLVCGVNEDDGGSNGAGKSAVIEGLHWVLFGSTVRKLSTVTDVIRYEADGAGVTVRLTQGARELRVTRSRTLTKGTVTIELDGADITPSSSRDADAKIVELLGIDSRTFQTTTLLSADTHMLSALTPAARERALLDFLGVGFEDARRRIGVARRQAKSDAHEVELERARWEGQHKARASELERRIEELVAEQDRVRDVKVTAAEIAEEVKRVRGVIDLLGDTAAASVRLAEIDDELTQLQAEQAAYQRELAEARGKHSATLIPLQKLRQLHKHGLTCPTCMQSMDHAQFDDALKRVEADASDAQGAYEAVSERALSAEVSKRITKLSRERAGVVGREQQRVRQTLMLSKLEAKLEAAEASVARYKTLAEQSSVYRRKLREHKAEKWKPSPEHAKLSARVEQLDGWHKAFGGGLGTYLIDNLADWLNERISRYVTGLYGADDVGPCVQVETRESGVHLRILHGGRDVEYGALSAGQRAVVDTALQAALHDVQLLAYGGVGLLVFDEAASALDAGKYDHLVNVGSVKLEGRVQSLWYITHRPVDWEPDFVITARLRDGVTSYETWEGGRDE